MRQPVEKYRFSVPAAGRKTTFELEIHALQKTSAPFIARLDEGGNSGDVWNCESVEQKAHDGAWRGPGRRSRGNAHFDLWRTIVIIHHARHNTALPLNGKRTSAAKVYRKLDPACDPAADSLSLFRCLWIQDHWACPLRSMWGWCPLRRRRERVRFRRRSQAAYSSAALVSDRDQGDGAAA